jgi:PPOX class probable F420-dependent enzyme
MQSIPQKYHDLLKDETRAFLYLATTMPDGSPQVTPVWFDIEGETIRINSAKGRVKDHNMRARPQVAVCIQDPNDPYRYVQVKGKVVEITEEGALEHIKRLSDIYTGKPWRGAAPSEIRVIYKIQPEKIDQH